MRRKTVLLFAAALAAGSLGTASCSLRRQKRRSPRLVRIEGVKKCWNYSLSPWLWYAGRNEDARATLFVRDGDILAVQTKEDADGRTPFPYLESDGTSLSLRTEHSRLLLEGVTVSLTLSEDAAGWTWLEGATEKERSQLRLVEFRGGVDAEKLPMLKRLARVNPDIHLVLGSAVALRDVLRLFRPRWLHLDGLSVGKNDLAALSRQRKLEVVWIDVSDVEDLAFLSRLPDLRRLLMVDWDPEKTGPFPEGGENLESLVISDSDMKDLSPISRLTGLRELHLEGCESLTDVSALSGFPAIEILQLVSCGELLAFSVLKELKGITWLGLPEEITQEQFAAVVADHPELRVLELHECERINDLTPSKGLSKLEGLVLLGRLANYEPLHGTKSLRLLVLPEEAFEERAEEVRKLEEALPECNVVAGGLCLGSGWILALLPAAGIACLLSRGRRPPRNA